MVSNGESYSIPKVNDFIMGLLVANRIYERYPDVGQKSDDGDGGF